MLNSETDSSTSPTSTSIPQIKEAIPPVDFLRPSRAIPQKERRKWENTEKIHMLEAREEVGCLDVDQIRPIVNAKNKRIGLPSRTGPAIKKAWERYIEIKYWGTTDWRAIPLTKGLTTEGKQLTPRDVDETTNWTPGTFDSETSATVEFRVGIKRINDVADPWIPEEDNFLMSVWRQVGGPWSHEDIGTIINTFDNWNEKKHRPRRGKNAVKARLRRLGWPGFVRLNELGPDEKSQLDSIVDEIYGAKSSPVVDLNNEVLQKYRDWAVVNNRKALPRNVLEKRLRWRQKLLEKRLPA
jgi:hypothetical protein